MFKHAIGDDGLKVIKTFSYAAGEDPNDWRVVKEKMEKYCIGEVNEIYERYCFNKRDKLPTESIDSFVAELKTLAKTCNFRDCLRDSLIRDRIVLGVKKENTTRKLLRERDLTLNRRIDICRSEEIGRYLLLHPEKPDPEKMPRPQNRDDVLRLNGMVNYLSRFLPHLSDVMKTLRELTHKQARWCWSDVQEKAWSKVKNLISTAPVLANYRTTEALEIQCDSSQSGLGAALLQNGQPIAYASRALTDTLQGMRIRLQRHDLEVRYERGNRMFLADTLSRAYLPSCKQDEAEFETISMMKYLPISEARLQQIQRETNMDESLQVLKAVIQHGWPEHKSALPDIISPYFNMIDEMSVQDGLIFKGERVVVRQAARGELLKRIHNPHLGVNGSLNRARECLYWSGMTGDIKNHVSTCEACGEYQRSQTKETLMSHETPSRPWQYVAVDIFECDGKSYLVTSIGLLQ